MGVRKQLQLKKQDNMNKITAATIAATMIVIIAMSQENKSIVDASAVRERIRKRIESPPTPPPLKQDPALPVVKEEKVPIGPVLDIRVNVEDPAWIVFQRPLILAEQERRIASHPGNERYILQKDAVVKKLNEVVAASFVIAANSENDSLKVLQAMEFWRTNRVDAEGRIVPLK